MWTKFFDKRASGRCGRIPTRNSLFSTDTLEKWWTTFTVRAVFCLRQICARRNNNESVRVPTLFLLHYPSISTKDWKEDWKQNDKQLRSVTSFSLILLRFFCARRSQLAPARPPFPQPSILCDAPHKTSAPQPKTLLCGSQINAFWKVNGRCMGIVDEVLARAAGGFYYGSSIYIIASTARVVPSCDISRGAAWFILPAARWRHSQFQPDFSVHARAWFVY